MIWICGHDTYLFLFLFLSLFGGRTAGSSSHLRFDGSCMAFVGKERVRGIYADGYLNKEGRTLIFEEASRCPSLGVSEVKSLLLDKSL